MTEAKTANLLFCRASGYAVSSGVFCDLQHTVFITNMSASSNSWFVKTGFGAELGPMPHDALAEMARTSALLPDDIVRDAADEIWKPAREIPGLFDSNDAIPVEASQEVEAWTKPDSRLRLSLTVPPQNMASSDADSCEGTPAAVQPALAALTSLDELDSVNFGTELKAEPKPPPTPPATGALANAEPSEQPRFSTSIDSHQGSRDTAISSAPTPSSSGEELISTWKTSRGPTRDQLAMKTLADEIDHGLPSHPAAPPPEIPDITLDEPSPPPASLVAETPVKAPPRIQRPSLMSQIEPPPMPQAARETWPRKWDRWKRSLPGKPIVAGLVVLLVATWWFWPRSQRGIYDRLAAVSRELRERRANARDKQGWDTFLTRAKSEIDELTPWLEEHARADSRELQLLLYVSRDCLKPMLEKPQSVDPKTEKQLQFFLDSLQRIYDPTTAAANLANASDTNSAAAAAGGLASAPTVSEPSHQPKQASE